MFFYLRFYRVLLIPSTTDPSTTNQKTTDHLLTNQPTNQTTTEPRSHGATDPNITDQKDTILFQRVDN